MQSFHSQEETGNTQDLFSNVSHVSSTRTVTSVKKTVDEFGNVISQDIQTSTVEGGDVVGEEEQMISRTVFTEVAKEKPPMICTPICTDTDYSPSSASAHPDTLPAKISK